MIRYAKHPVEDELSRDYTIKCNGIEMQAYYVRVSAVPYNTMWPGKQRPLDQTELASVLSFEADESVELEVEVAWDFDEAIVRPLSKNVKVQKCGRVCKFTIDKCGQYTLELDGYHKALHIFVDQVFDFVAKTKNVIHYKAGIHYGDLELDSNTTVILDRGAILYGNIWAFGAENVSIIGYGMIDGSKEIRSGQTLLVPLLWKCKSAPKTLEEYRALEDRVIACYGRVAAFGTEGLNDADYELMEKLKNERAGAANTPILCNGTLIPNTKEEYLEFVDKLQILKGNVRFLRCKNCVLQGVTLRDSATFSVIPANCDNVYIDGVKLIGMWKYNSDGIDLFNSSNVMIKNSFLRNFNDCIVIKGMKGWDDHSNENILVENCVTWCDWGRCLEVGAETNAPEFRNIVFRDCDCIHGSYCMMDIQHHNRADIHHIAFEDIRCEYSRYQKSEVYQSNMDLEYPDPKNVNHPLLIELIIHGDGFFGEDDEHIGSMHDITFKNITAFTHDASVVKSKFTGYDNEHRITRVRVLDVMVNNEKIIPNIQMNDFVSDVITE